MALNSHGIRAGSKVDRPDEAKGKGRRKGKGKGRGGRRFFRSRKGKGRGKGRRKGRSHMVSEEGYEEEWNEGDEWNDSYEAYRADDQNWTEGFLANEGLYYLDEYGYFQRKRKGKGKMHHQLYVPLTLDAQELWALDEQLKLSADMLTHIPTVVFGMKFSQQVQDFSLHILNNPGALRNL